MKVHYFIFFLILLTFTGCGSTKTTNNCDQLDWYELGRNQGARGINLNLKIVQDYCPAQDIKEPIALFKNGYNAGISDYCKPKNGFEMGRSGGQYDNSCPIEVEAFFVRSYHLGIESYLLEHSKQKMNQEISKVRSELLNPNLSESEISLHKQSLKNLTNKTQAITNKILSLKTEVSNSTATF